MWSIGTKTFWPLSAWPTDMAVSVECLPFPLLPSFQAAVLVLLSRLVLLCRHRLWQVACPEWRRSCTRTPKTQLFGCVFGGVLCQKWWVWDATGLTWETPVGSIHASGRYFLPAVEWAMCCLILHCNKFHSFGLCSYQTLLTANFPACNSILKSIPMLLKWLLKCFQVVPGLQLYELPHLSQIWISWCFPCFRFLPKAGIFGARILVLVFPFYFKIAQLF